MSSPAWQPDPTGRHQYRYFDGTKWTEHVSNHGTASVDWQLPSQDGPTGPAVPPTAPGAVDPPEAWSAHAAPTGLAPPSGAATSPPTSAVPSVPTPQTPTMPTASPGGPPLHDATGGSFWKNWWVWLGVVVLVVGAIVAVVLIAGGDDEGEQVVVPIPSSGSLPELSIPDLSIPDLTIPDLSIPDIPTSTLVATPAPDPTVPSTEPGQAPTTVAQPAPSTEGLGIGEAASQGESQVRLNAVVADQPSSTAGYTVTSLEIEACGAGTPFNPLFWTVELSDGSTALPPFDSMTVSLLNSGAGCGRVIGSFDVPDGARAISLLIPTADYRSETRWAFESPAAPQLDPLGPYDVGGVPIGESVPFSGSGSVTVRSVETGVETTSFIEPPDGVRLDRIAVEVCAADAELVVGPTSFSSQSTDGFINGSFIYANDLSSDPIAPGACIEGTVDLIVPEGATLMHIMFSNTRFDEIARWKVG